MKIAFINGSPRKKRGISAKLLRFLEEKLPGCEIVTGWAPSCDAYVFAFPLYVDGVPSSLLRELVAHEREMPAGARVYAIVNNGFYEGTQNANAIAILRNWSLRADLAWGQGIGAGGGPTMENLKFPMGRGPLTTLGRAMDTLAEHILAGGGGEDIYTKPDVPRWIYKLAGEAGMRKAGKQHGLRPKDMGQGVRT